jgi:hypothetical protein
MFQLTNKQIKDIAEQLDCGFRCFINKTSTELIFVPDENRNFGIDTEAWVDDLEKLENNFSDYYEIEQLESSDSFKIMADFAESLSDSIKLKSKLIYALNNNKPFRKFKFEIDNSGEYRQHWFDFKARKLEEWVRSNFESISNLK